MTSFLELGTNHILGGWDHLAFLVVLLVAARGIGSIVAVVTAFTAAHSITLGLAALDVVRLPGRLVELAIALSIAYVAAENLILKRPGARLGAAFGFGLVHGLGFAGFLGDALVFEPLKIAALFGFNVGVELGQLAVVVPLALLLRVLPGDRKSEDPERAWFAPRWLRLGASSVVVLLGLGWFVERAGWVAWS